MKNEEGQPKIGAGHASAMWRQGLAELRDAMYPDSNVAQPAHYGIYGTVTPGEAQKEREADLMPSHSEPANAAIAEQADLREQQHDTREPPSREPEME